MSKAVNIRDAMTDPHLFGTVFGGDSFAAWRALLAGFYGLHLDATEAETFKALTGRPQAITQALAELWLVVGRRGGKSHVAAFLAVYEACFKDHTTHLSAGEIATVMVIAADRKQARTIMRFVSGLVNGNAMLARMVVRENSELIEFNNRCAIEIGTASHRTIRGYTLAAAILDEVAFWVSDGMSPDAEIVAALRPALATLGGPLIALSSPYSRRGVLWNTYRQHYGTDTTTLVAQAASRTMNPTLPQRVVDSAVADDPARAAAEYGAEFRTDIESFVDPEVIEDATRPRPLELPPATGIDYFGFVDPSGGGADEFTLAIAHHEAERAVVDLVRGRKGSPAAIVAEFAEILARYGVRVVNGDRYAGQWPRDEFQKHGIAYDVSDLDRSGLYLETLAALNSGRVELPPCQVTARQFAGLERRTGRSGKDSIDHAPGGHDDRANAIAGAVYLAIQPATQAARTPRPGSLTSSADERQAERERGWRGTDSGAEHSTSQPAGISGPMVVPADDPEPEPARDPDRLNWLAAAAKYGPTPVGAQWDYASQTYRHRDGRIARPKTRKVTA